MCTLFELVNLTPLNEKEKEHYNFDQNILNRIKYQLEKDYFWLGGQLKMNKNDIINLDTIQQVKNITKQRMLVYGEPCNSFEAASINNFQKQLEFIERMIESYNLIIELRKNQSNII